MGPRAARQSWRLVSCLALGATAAGGACQPTPDEASQPPPAEAPADPTDPSADSGTDTGAATGQAAPQGADAGPGVAAAAVRVGIEVLLVDSLHLVRARRVGLITNHTGRAGGSSTIDLLHEHPEVELAALFGPEHGLRGDADPGEAVADSVDERTGVPIHSLYGGTRRPDPAHLADLDVLLFDIQDVGARYYTYLWTMSLAMEAAGEAGVPFVVLDRPNPIGGRVQGNVLDRDFATFVGLHEVPMRHGLTPGEMARLVHGAFGVEADLHVVPLAGWQSDIGFEDTGLPWIPPSPNIPSVASALHYPGTCLFEGTNLSVGRGTDAAFQQIGAPWLDGEALAAALNARGLAGVRFEPVTFTPVRPGDGKYAGETVRGVRFVATDEQVYDPTVSAVAALIEARSLAGERWEWLVAHFDRLAGTDALRQGIEAGDEVDALTAGWAEALAAFEAMAAPYRLYR